jgi:solute carrier family 50 (sugar transporter)
MSGNCLGWVVYGYYTADPFVVAANLPGLLLSLWLNMGAAKLQYYERAMTHKHLLLSSSVTAVQSTTPTSSSHHQQHNMSNHSDSRASPTSVSPSRAAATASLRRLIEEGWNASPVAVDDSGDGVVEQPMVPLMSDAESREFFVAVPQEQALMRILVAWSLLFIYVGWLSPTLHPARTIGIVVNVNLVFFYGAPLQTMRAVIQERTSASIHLPTMFMNYVNTSFWIMYGYSRRDPLILTPNAMGLLLGLVQGVLCLIYPRHRRLELDPLSLETDPHGSPAVHVGHIA